MRNPQNRWSHLSKVCFETSALLKWVPNNSVSCFLQIGHFILFYLFFQRKKAACRWRKSLSTSTSAHRQTMLMTSTQILNELRHRTSASRLKKTVQTRWRIYRHTTAGWVKASQYQYEDKTAKRVPSVCPCQLWPFNKVLYTRWTWRFLRSTILYRHPFCQENCLFNVVQMCWALAPHVEYNPGFKCPELTCIIVY